MRRRPRGREEETQTSGGNRGMPQRGSSTQPPSNDNTKQGNSQEATPPPQPPQPQFDLEAAAFPPLPGDKNKSFSVSHGCLKAALNYDVVVFIIMIRLFRLF